MGQEREARKLVSSPHPLPPTPSQNVIQGSGKRMETQTQELRVRVMPLNTEAMELHSAAYWHNPPPHPEIPSLPNAVAASLLKATVVAMGLSTD